MVGEADLFVRASEAWQVGDQDSAARRSGQRCTRALNTFGLIAIGRDECAKALDFLERAAERAAVPVID